MAPMERFIFWANHPNRNLHQFAVYRLSEMLDELEARYYAMHFPA
jgi:hypothetical protein